MANNKTTHKGFKKIREIRKWWKKKKTKPVTWGEYWKMCKISMGIVAIFYVCLFVGYKVYDKITDWRYEKKLEAKVEED